MKVYVNVTARLIIETDSAVPIEDVLSDMDYNFTSQTIGSTIRDTEITDWEIIKQEYNDV